MIRLIIERKIKSGKEHGAWDLIHNLRNKAMRQNGYISGETLSGYYDSSLWVAISTWLEAEDCKAWLNSSERKALEGRENALIDAPVKFTILKFFEKPLISEEPVEPEELEAEKEAQHK
jgi:antibiotic biosynthesis monooxygenase (ABM) superfamily enzyme